MSTSETRLAELLYHAEGFSDMAVAGTLGEAPVWIERALTAEHSGDCTKQPWSCERCHAEEFTAIARYVAARWPQESSADAITAWNTRSGENRADLSEARAREVLATDLPPCSFCEHEMRLGMTDIDGWIAYVACDGCDMRGPVSEFKYDDVSAAQVDALNRWYNGKNACRATETRAQPSSDALREAGRFLLDRLVDHEVRMTSDEDANEWHGHVTPAMARLRQALSTSDSSEPAEG